MQRMENDCMVFLFSYESELIMHAGVLLKMRCSEILT